MKKILSLTFLFACIGINAQNNLVVFSENGEKFFLIINGVKQNLEAETNVKVTDLIQPNYKAKIVFEDKTKGVVDQNIYFMQGGEPVKNHEFVFSVGIKKKGGYKARPVSAVAIGPQTKADPEQAVVHYSTTEPTSSNNNVVSNNGSTSSNVHVADDGTTGSSNIQVNQTVTETKTGVSTGDAGNTKVDVSMNGLGVNININDNMGGMGNTTTTSQTVTTTTTSSGGNMSNSSTTTKSSSSTTGISKNSSAASSTKTKPVVDGYEKSTTTTVAAGCSTPMSDADFESAKESVNTGGIDDTKLKIAKQVVDANCLSTEQVKDMMELLSFEKAKLDLAKYGYGRVTDKRNYYKINDALTFESSKTELDAFINSTKKSSTK